MNGSIFLGCCRDAELLLVIHMGDVSAYKLRLPASVADQNSPSYSPERGEDGTKRGEGDIEACCAENAVHFHINNIIRVRIPRDFLVGPQILLALCHNFLRCV